MFAYSYEEDNIQQLLLLLLLQLLQILYFEKKYTNFVKNDINNTAAMHSLLCHILVQTAQKTGLKMADQELFKPRELATLHSGEIDTI